MNGQKVSHCLLVLRQNLQARRKKVCPKMYVLVEAASRTRDEFVLAQRRTCRLEGITRVARCYGSALLNRR